MLSRQRRDERVWLDDGVERLERDRGAVEVGQHEVGLAEPNVDGDDEAVVRPDVEHHRLAAARRLHGGSLIDRPVAQQLADERRHHPSADAHPAREVGPRDGLMLAHEIEDDLPVDLPGRGASGANETAGVDLPHSESVVLIGYGKRRRRFDVSGGRVNWSNKSDIVRNLNKCGLASSASLRRRFMRLGLSAAGASRGPVLRLGSVHPRRGARAVRRDARDLPLICPHGTSTRRCSPTTRRSPSRPRCSSCRITTSSGCCTRAACRWSRSASRRATAPRSKQTRARSGSDSPTTTICFAARRPGAWFDHELHDLFGVRVKLDGEIGAARL